VALQSKPAATRQLANTAFGLGAQYGVLLPFGRTQESEADELGLYFMAMAGYNPEAAVPFWQRMAQQGGGQRPPEFLSTHPAPETRIRDIRRITPKTKKYQGKYVK
ncbi:MAG: M48 family metallopeptidase, partial [Tunicatimonas sp.]|uniref:M48 family metallopeptidase n=1 Tax=Tunicatimonas sp. TaxID=1940096 RepID=UPI003C7891A0